MFILSQLWQKRFVIQYTIFHPFPALAETLCYMYNMYNTLFHPFPALAKTLCYTMYNFSSFPSYDEYIDTLSKRLLSPNYILIWSTQHFIYPQLLLRYGWASSWHHDRPAFHLSIADPQVWLGIIVTPWQASISSTHSCSSGMVGHHRDTMTGQHFIYS